MTSKEALYKLYSYSLLDNDIEKQIVEVIEKDLDMLETIKSIIDNSFDETYEETMDKIYAEFMKYDNEKARLENDKRRNY